MQEKIVSEEYWFIYKNDKLVGLTDNHVFLNLFCLSRKKYLDPEDFSKYYIRHLKFDEISDSMLDDLLQEYKNSSCKLEYLNLVKLTDEDITLDTLVMSSQDYMTYCDYIESILYSMSQCAEVILDCQKYLNKYNNHSKLFKRFKKFTDDYCGDFSGGPEEEYNTIIKPLEVFKYLIKYRLIY